MHNFGSRLTNLHNSIDFYQVETYFIYYTYTKSNLIVFVQITKGFNMIDENIFRGVSNDITAVERSLATW